MPSQTKVSSLTLGSMLACLSLIFTYVEFLIPIHLGVPGVKLGLANLVIIIALYGLGARYALTINVVRIALAGLLFSGVFGILYSMAGGLISLGVMILLHKTRKFSIVGVSMAGGVAHNFGQIFVASQIVSNSKVFIYFPLLLFSGLVAGIAIGIFAHIICKKIPPHLFPNAFLEV